MDMEEKGYSKKKVIFLTALTTLSIVALIVVILMFIIVGPQACSSSTSKEESISYIEAEKINDNLKVICDRYNDSEDGYHIERFYNLNYQEDEHSLYLAASLSSTSNIRIYRIETALDISLEEALNHLLDHSDYIVTYSEVYLSNADFINIKPVFNAAYPSSHGVNYKTISSIYSFSGIAKKDNAYISLLDIRWIDESINKESIIFQEASTSNKSSLYYQYLNYLY